MKNYENAYRHPKEQQIDDSEQFFDLTFSTI